MKVRHRVLGLLTSMSLLTYLDRVCISIAGPRIQDELHLSPHQWGLVGGAFAIAYALFEVPSGSLADRYGARAMLTRIVLWWSVFTTLTGFVTRLWPLIVVRFLFGVGEAGAYPTASSSVFRWFPEIERGRAFGFIFSSGQIGGALAPLLIVPIQARFGWRASFYLFGALGLWWAASWWRGYRDHPGQVEGIGQAELAELAEAAAAGGAAGGSTGGSAGGATPRQQHGLHAPWRAIACHASVWSLMGATFAYVYAYYFFLFWLPTYMMRERGFTEVGLTFSALPFVIGALCNVCGGFVRDAAVRRLGLRWGTRAVGASGLLVAAAAAIAALLAANRYAAIAWLCLCYGGITLQQPTVFATCVEIGKRFSGAIAGCVNMAGAVGGLFSSVLMGILVERTLGYDAVLLSMAATLVLGAMLWLRTDATETLEAAGAARESRSR